MIGGDMIETKEETIKRLKFCRDCIDRHYKVGAEEYDRLDKIIEELEKEETNNEQKDV